MFLQNSNSISSFFIIYSSHFCETNLNKKKVWEHLHPANIGTAEQIDIW